MMFINLLVEFPAIVGGSPSPPPPQPTKEPGWKHLSQAVFKFDATNNRMKKSGISELSPHNG